MSGCEDVSSLAYKDTKKNQKMERLAAKLGFVQAFLFPQLFFFFCFTILRECHCITNNCVLSFDASLTCELERVCQLFEVLQHEFANLNLPCEVRFRQLSLLVFVIRVVDFNALFLSMASYCYYFRLCNRF